MRMSEQDSKLLEQIQLVNNAFTPAAPVSQRDLFSGRQEQLIRVFDIRSQAGQHGAIYGDRGVGKTSLAIVGSSSEGSPRPIHYTCNSADTFASVWDEVFKDLAVTVREPRTGFMAEDVARAVNLRTALGVGDDGATPNDVRRAMKMVEASRPTFVIDEFDQVEHVASRTLMADTIKILSDQGIGVTLLVVGVGGTIEDLIAEHASIERCLVQVHMQRMRVDELRDIIIRGMEKAQLGIEDAFVDRVARLSAGLPSYTHLIAQHAGRHAVERGETSVTLEYLKPAIEMAQSDVSRTVLQAYTNATREGSKPTHFKKVLAACALANKDELGSFGTPQVREALSKYLHVDMDIPAFTPHLNDFSGDGKRGGILSKEGKPGGRQLYEFRNPLLPPYVVMRAYAEGLLEEIPDM